MKKTIIPLILAWGLLFPALTQAQFRLTPYGNLDHWQVREIHESSVIGGQTKYLYEISPNRDTIKVNKPYYHPSLFWKTSNSYAKVKGITEGSVMVFPEKRGNGYAARLETRVESVTALGLINIHVMASGSIFTGSMIEPITDTKNPLRKLSLGVPFTQKPKALQFDYKVITGGPCRRIDGGKTGKAVGFNDQAEAQVLLQHRWEDAQGNLHAHRVGTGWVRFSYSQTSWQNGYQIPIHYGNIVGKPFYQSYMNLLNGSLIYYAKNSHGKMVPVIEEGWGTENEEVTHIIIRFSASYKGEDFIGNPNSKFWLDNIGLVY